MADEPKSAEAFSLKRWSQRKLAAARTESIDPLPSPVAAPPSVPAPATVATDAAPLAASEAVPLPPVESLTFESDFSAFMQPKIDQETKRAALRKLFSDPSFNVMDGLDIYVGDYTQADPMPAGMLEKLSSVYAMLDPIEPPSDDKDAAVEVAVAGIPAAESEPEAPAETVLESTPATDAAVPIVTETTVKPE